MPPIQQEPRATEPEGQGGKSSEVRTTPKVGDSVVIARWGPDNGPRSSNAIGCGGSLVYKRLK